MNSFNNIKHIHSRILAENTDKKDRPKQCCKSLSQYLVNN